MVIASLIFGVVACDDATNPQEVIRADAGAPVDVPPSDGAQGSASDVSASDVSASDGTQGSTSDVSASDGAQGSASDSLADIPTEADSVQDDAANAEVVNSDDTHSDASAGDAITSDVDDSKNDGDTVGSAVVDVGATADPDANMTADAAGILDVVGGDADAVLAETIDQDAAGDGFPSDGSDSDTSDVGGADAGLPWAGPCTAPVPYEATPTQSLVGAPHPKPPPVPCGTKPGWPGGPSPEKFTFTVATKTLGLGQLPYLTPCILMRDFDDDGKQDLVVVALPIGPGAQPAVLQHRQTKSGWSVNKIPLSSVTMVIGCMAADIDDDGDEDVVLASTSGWLMLRNDAGTLATVNTGLPAIVGAGGTNFSLAALDWDRDGDLDLIGGPHFQPQGGSGIPVTLKCANSPKPYTICPQVGNFGKGVNLRLFRNDGQFNFTDITPSWPKLNGDLLSLTPHDFDRDGWPDVFLGHDFGVHGWMRNLGNGKAKWLSKSLGMRPYAHSMGAVVADMDGDGLQDIVMSDYGVDTYYKRKPDGTYGIDSKKLGVWEKTLTTVSWGQVAHDLNQDGYPDLVTGISTNATGATFWGNANKLAPKQNSGHIVYRNVGGGKMVSTWLEYSLPATSSIEPVGISVGDIDGDGDLDIVATRLPGHLIIFRNDTPKVGKSLHVRLKGLVSNHSGVGAWVRIRKGNHVQERYVRTAEGYGANVPKGAHFGVGTVAVLDEVTVWWPSGRMNTLLNVKTNVPLEVTEPKSP